MTTQERGEQGENVHVEAAHFGVDQHPMIARMIAQKEEQGELDSSYVSGIGGGQPTLVDVKTVEKLLEKLDKEWKDKCHEYLEKEREKNTKLKTTVEELREKNLNLTRQVRDLQNNCQLLLVKAKEAGNQANCWMIEYEAALHSSSYEK